MFQTSLFNLAAAFSAWPKHGNYVSALAASSLAAAFSLFSTFLFSLERLSASSCSSCSSFRLAGKTFFGTHEHLQRLKNGLQYDWQQWNWKNYASKIREHRRSLSAFQMSYKIGCPQVKLTIKQMWTSRKRWTSKTFQTSKTLKKLKRLPPPVFFSTWQRPFWSPLLVPPSA